MTTPAPTPTPSAAAAAPRPMRAWLYLAVVALVAIAVAVQLRPESDPAVVGKPVSIEQVSDAFAAAEYTTTNAAAGAPTGTLRYMLDTGIGVTVTDYATDEAARTALATRTDSQEVDCGGDQGREGCVQVDACADGACAAEVVCTTAIGTDVAVWPGTLSDQDLRRSVATASQDAAARVGRVCDDGAVTFDELASGFLDGRMLPWAVSFVEGGEQLPPHAGLAARAKALSPSDPPGSRVGVLVFRSVREAMLAEEQIGTTQIYGSTVFDPQNQYTSGRLPLDFQVQRSCNVLLAGAAHIQQINLSAQSAGASPATLSAAEEVRRRSKAQDRADLKRGTAAMDSLRGTCEE